VGTIGERRRLFVAGAVPSAGADQATLVGLLATRLRAAAADLADETGLTAAGAQLPRLAATGSPPPLVVVVAATESTRATLEADAAAAGWLTAGASLEVDGALSAIRLATRPEAEILVAGTAGPATSDERDLVGEIVALVAGVARRRPRLAVVLAGAAAAHVGELPAGTDLMAVPHPHGEQGEGLRVILTERRAGPDGARRALAAVAGSLASVLDLRIELLEVGVSGSLRVRASPSPDPGGLPVVRAAEVPAAALGCAEDEAVLDRVEAWTTVAMDRARLRDRLAEMRQFPWTELEGEGALLRAAALRGSVERLVETTEAELGGPAPDLVVLAGGAWCALPAPASMIVFADAVRRPGIVQVATDAARLLAPLGTVSDVDARAALVADLVTDILVPVGTLVLPGGIRGEKVVGHLRLKTTTEVVEMPLTGGGLSLVDLPPGQQGAAELSFRGPVGLGPRGRRFAVRVTGGLAGLVMDLRDVRLRLPERSEHRRAALDRWELALWPGRDV
jgi:hypothetical protein